MMHGNIKQSDIKTRQLNGKPWLYVVLYDRQSGKTIEASPGEADGKLQIMSDRYTLEVTKSAQPILDRKTERVIHVDAEEKKELLKDEMNYSDVEEVPESKGAINWDDMSLTKLRAYAKEQGMKNTTKKDRPQIMEFLNN